MLQCLNELLLQCHLVALHLHELFMLLLLLLMSHVDKLQERLRN